MDDLGSHENFASENDCRAIRKDGILWKALVNGELSPLVDLVRNNSDIELCFRGNSSTDSITIYYNNREFIKCYEGGSKIKYTFNKNHSRYYKDRDIINRETEFTLKKEPKDFGKFYELRKKVMESYFDEKDTIDYIKNPKGVSVRNKKCQYEKQEQQKLMSNNVNRKDGYYFYDFEYAQAFASQELKNRYEKLTKGEKHNEPDFLAIRYKDNKPEALVFVELKTTEGAMKTKGSSAIDHMIGMRNFIKWDRDFNHSQFIYNRLQEAQKIMEEYQELGLHNCGNRPVEDFSKIDNIEILLVITDNSRINLPSNKTARAYYEKNKDRIRKVAKEEHCDIILLEPGVFELDYEKRINLNN